MYEVHRKGPKPAQDSVICLIQVKTWYVCPVTVNINIAGNFMMQQGEVRLQPSCVTVLPCCKMLRGCHNSGFA